MKRRTTVFAALLFAMVIAGTTPAYSGTILGFSEGFQVFLSPRACQWTNVADVTINAPEAGYVVVTASGMVAMNTNAVLELTLATSPSVEGDWVFWLTAAPPMPTYQTYTVRRVFQVGPGIQTFYLNAEGCNPRQRKQMSVETGSVTAEFYVDGSVQPGQTINSLNAQTQVRAQSQTSHSNR